LDSGTYTRMFPTLTKQEKGNSMPDGVADYENGGDKAHEEKDEKPSRSTYHPPPKKEEKEGSTHDY